MRRTLISIGCDEHQHLEPLTGAVNDAQRIFNALLPIQGGDYDGEASILLRSPTIQETRDALRGRLFDGEAIDTLTIFFAGHGAVSAGSFYMAFRDTQADALSATAISLGELLRMIAEVSPRQTYVIIDACEGGGLIADLGVILKSEVLGRSGTPGLTLLATAASNENAQERGGSGVGTDAILDCINGKTFLQDSRPTLDLVEIGQAVAGRVRGAGLQSPVVWGLNLVGAPSFCRNPHAGTGNAPLRSLLSEWSDQESETAIRSFLPRLWGPYVAIPETWNARLFVDVLATILAEIAANPSTRVTVVRRISDAFASRAAESNDRFRVIEVRAASAIALLPYSELAEVESYLEHAASDLADAAKGAIADVVAALKEDRFALLNGGLSELYYLPLRLTRLLGWLGFATHVNFSLGRDLNEISELTDRLLSLILDHYSLSLAAMSDAQAPPLAIAFTGLHRLDRQDEAEQLIGYLLTSFVANAGKPARDDIPPQKILAYLYSRHRSDLSEVQGLIAQPTELGTVILRSAGLFGLTDPVDEALESLDHLAINAYVSDDLKAFGDEIIKNGLNATYMIGHDIWTVADLINQWPAMPKPPSRAQGLTAIIAALIFPDRTPWFLYPDQITAVER